ncbi:MAG: prolyl oligopeptidase family serine peptidase [Micromonosporaceae bacterium]
MDHTGDEQLTHRAGTPHTITLAQDGSRLFFLRAKDLADPANRLWVLDLETGEERLLTEQHGLDQYAADRACLTAVGTSSGRLIRVSAQRGVEELSTAGLPRTPRPDPTGARLAYLTQGSLRVIDERGADTLLAGEGGSGDGHSQEGTTGQDGVSGGAGASGFAADPGREPRVRWGEPDPVATEVFGLRRGYWWAPDGDRILALRVEAGNGRADGLRPPAVSLHLLDLDGSWVDVRWDRLTYPHLASVAWDWHNGPLVTVLPRVQHHALVLAVDVRTGETQVHAELDDPRWVTITPGTPAYLPDGRVVLGGELNVDSVDTHCLFADGALLTPPWLHVRRLCGQMPGPSSRPGQGVVDLIVEGSEGEPSEQHVYRLRLASRSGNPEVTRLTPNPGWHRGHAAGDAYVISSQSLDHAGAQVTTYRGERTCQIASHAEAESAPPRPALLRVTDRRLPCGVLYPADHVPGRRLPVLVEVVSGPARQGVTAARERWRRQQWRADSGYAVVVIDSRGAIGVSPSFEKLIHRRVWDLTLTDQTEALAVAASKHPDLDLSRVAIRGVGFGGSIAIAGALRYPEVYAAAVAGSPVVDWSRLGAGYAERYLGLPEENPEAYARHDLAAEAAELRRPVLLHASEEGDVAWHTERFAAAVQAAGEPAVSHLTRITAGSVAEDVLEAEMRFIAEALRPNGATS